MSNIMTYVKIITRTSFLRTRHSPFYNQLDLMILNYIYEIEVLKFVYKFIKDYFPKCFESYFLPASKIYNY